MAGANNTQSRNKIDFLFELRVLLDRYDVDVVAAEEYKSYGVTHPLVELQFNRPYGVYQFTAISAIDEVEADATHKIA